MKKVKLLAFLIFLYSFSLHAQSLDCSSKIKSLAPNSSFNFNELSKSATCVTGKKYEFVIPLLGGKEYRISFHASSVFNNKINFRIIDENTGEKVLDLPGETEDPRKGSCVLVPYLDNEINRMVHPHFDFVVKQATRLKIIIDIADKRQQTQASSAGYAAPKDTNRGCITVFIQDRNNENEGFQNN